MTQKFVENSECGSDVKKKFKNVEFDEALDYTGYGKYNIILLLACGAGLYTINSEAYSLGYVLPLISCDMQLSTSKKAILTSANFIGLSGACTFCGFLADVKGRRRILIICFLLSFVTSLGASFMPCFWGVAFFRLLNGIFISGPSSILYAYFGEFHSQKSRAKCIAFLCFFIGFALIFLPAVAWAINAHDLHFTLFNLPITGWRIFFIINSFPSLISALAIIKLHESPKFLYYNKNVSKSFEILRDIYFSNNGKNGIDYPVENLKEKTTVDNAEGTRRGIFLELWNQIKPFLRKPYIVYIFVACFIQATLFAISSGLFLWYPDIRNQVKNTDSNRNVSLTICSALDFVTEESKSVKCFVDQDAYIQSIIIGAVYVGGYLSWGFMVKLMGNRNFFFICMVVSFVGCLLLSFVNIAILIDIFFVLAMVLPGICVSVINSILVDIFPTSMTSMAVSLAMTFGRLGSVVSSSVVGFMLKWNCVITFVFYAISLLVNLLMSFLFPKNNKIFKDG